MGVMRSPKEPILVPSCTCHQMFPSLGSLGIISQQFLFSWQLSSLQSTTPFPAPGLPITGGYVTQDAPGFCSDKHKGLGTPPLGWAPLRPLPGICALQLPLLNL